MIININNSKMFYPELADVVDETASEGVSKTPPAGITSNEVGSMDGQHLSEFRFVLI